MRELPPPPVRSKRDPRSALPAPVIRGAAPSDALKVRLPADEPLPQFTLWADDNSDAERTTKRATPTPGAVAEVSDADVTLPRPSRLPSFADESVFDWAPTLKKASLTPSEAAAVLLARRFRATTQLGGSSEAKPARTFATTATTAKLTTTTTSTTTSTTKKKSDTLRPVVASSADRTEELDLDEIEELPIESPRDTILDAKRAPSPSGAAPEVVELSSKDLIDASAEIRLDLSDLSGPAELEESIPLVPDTTLEVMALQRRRRVRKMGSRLIAGAVALGVLVLGIGGVRLGVRDLATSIEITYTTPSMQTAAAATPPRTDPEAAPKTIATVSTATAATPATKTTATSSIKTTPAKMTTPPKTPATKAAPFFPKAKSSTKGTLHTPASAAGHRVFVDGGLAGFAPNPIQLKCGTHTVKVGSAAKWQTINVPCGGDAYAK